MEGDKKEFSGMKKNARIKQSLFRDKRKNKGKGKKGEDEDKEMKRIKKTLEEQISNDGQVFLNTEIEGSLIILFSAKSELC